MDAELELLLRKLIAGSMNTLRNILQVEVEGKLRLVHVVTTDGKETVIDGKWLVDLYPEGKRITVAPRVITEAREKQCSLKRIIGPRDIPAG